MEDRDVVAAIVAGDPTGLAEAYDRYAVPLYAYCSSLLREPADAADAVQDTFLVAAAKLRGLRDAGKLRPWLYAVARNECFRRLRAANATSALDEAPDVPAQSAAPESEAERADLQALVRDAIDGLNPGERDVIELSLVHELAGDDLADALGVSRNHAHALSSRARGQLERALGALLVARTGRDACPELGAMLTGWDGHLTVLLRKRISRHIERCEICGERKRRELSPALFAGLTPLAALSPGFRDQLLRVMADRTPAGLAHRLGVANRAGPFGPAGFPRPARPPGPAPWHRVSRPARDGRHHSRAMLAGAATAVVAAGVIAVAIIGGGPPHGSSSAGGPADGANHSAAVRTGGPTPAHDGPAHDGPARNGPSASAGSGLTPAASRSGGTTAAEPPATSAASGPASSTSAPAAAPAAGSSSSAAATVSQGTLTASPGTVDLVTLDGTATGQLTITAHGGPVSDYSVTAGSALAGKLTVSPASGSLANGATATITVTSTSLVALDGTLTVNPGSHTITVVLSVGV